MLLTKFTKRTQAGLGLLELMLAMVIVALLLIMATRYYNNARTAARVQQGTMLINAAYAAANQISVGVGSYENVHDASALVALLPGQVLTGPWGKPLTALGGGGSPSTLTLTLPTDSSSTCLLLAGGFSGQSGAQASCSAGKITVVFNYDGSTPT